MPYLILAFAVLAETIGTSALQASQQFTRPLPAAITVVAYALAFWLRTFPVGIAYAIWSGLGIVFIAAIGYLVFGQRLDWPAVTGMGLILAGILVIHLFSGASPH